MYRACACRAAAAIQFDNSKFSHRNPIGFFDPKYHCIPIGFSALKYHGKPIAFQLQKSHSIPIGI